MFRSGAAVKKNNACDALPCYRAKMAKKRAPLKSVYVMVRLTPDQHALVSAASRAHDSATVAGWLRGLILRAAQKSIAG